MAFKLLLTSVDIIECVVETVGMGIRRTIFYDDIFELLKFRPHLFVMVAVSGYLEILHIFPLKYRLHVRKYRIIFKLHVGCHLIYVLIEEFENEE